MTKRLLFFTLTCILLASCQSYKKVPYLQDPGEAQRAVAEAKLYDARILPKDLLTSVVSVSYTHLDVYKRQDLRTTVRRMPRPSGS